MLSLISCGENSNNTQPHTHVFGEFVSNDNGTKSQTCSCDVKNVTIDENVLIVNNGVLSGLTDYGKTLSKIVIPNGITEIAKDAFNCGNLTSITLADTVTVINDYAFYNCKLLSSVILGNDLSIIGDYAFYNCISLTSLAIPESVTNIGEYAFACCDSLASVSLNNSMTYLSNYLFYNCKTLTNVAIPESVTNIGDCVFAGCGAITNIIIGENVTKIGSSAFAFCDLLTIYCKIESQPATWHEYWNDTNCPVVWGFKE